MTRLIVIADYDPDWPAEYAEEARRLSAAIGQHLLALEHIGSTSVPGLAAKPIIDIMAAVDQLERAQLCIEPLRALGYDYLPEVERFIPERRYFRRASGDLHTHHLHMVEMGSAFWRRHLLFRNYLRAHPQTAQDYARLKRELAARYVSDVAGYTEAKTAFIRAVESLAEIWSTQQSQSDEKREES
jgi:GrpB-like predicted nucleotidyltransferase (UPF0157 family)